MDKLPDRITAETDDQLRPTTCGRLQLLLGERWEVRRAMGDMARRCRLCIEREGGHVEGEGV